METAIIDNAIKRYLMNNDLIDFHIDLNLAHRFYKDQIFKSLIEHYIDRFGDQIKLAIDLYFEDFGFPEYNEYFCIEWAFDKNHEFAKSLREA